MQKFMVMIIQTSHFLDIKEKQSSKITKVKKKI